MTDDQHSYFQLNLMLFTAFTWYESDSQWLEAQRLTTNVRIFTTVDVRERGKTKYSEVISLFSAVPPMMSNAIETWIAVPHFNADDLRLFFTPLPVDESNQIDENETIDLRSQIEERLKSVCSVLTQRQRCADWFILRKFRMTGKIVGIVLLSSQMSGRHLGIESPHPKTGTEITRLFLSSWFSTSRSTEEVMRGGINEGNVLHASSQKSFVKDIHEREMLALNDVS